MALYHLNVGVNDGGDDNFRFVCPSINSPKLWFKLVVVIILVKIMMVVIMRMTSTFRFVWLNMKTSKLCGSDDDDGGAQIFKSFWPRPKHNS